MERKKPFVNVDELMPQVSVEQAAGFYGYVLPELIRVGSETRTACFLNCGKSKETGDRALAIQTDDPLKPWFCHQYGCGKNGNLVSLCDLMAPGVPAGGRPRGERFKSIATDLQAMAGGGVRSLLAATPAAPPKITPAPKKVNIILRESDNERARSPVNLDDKFVTDIAAMTPKASAYFRRRAYLTPEVCDKWRMGYLPRDAGGEDRSGGTMRGKVVYCYRDENGDPPAGKRLILLNVPEYTAVLQNEEHLVIETLIPNALMPGDVVYAIPTHVCPTCAMHQRAYVVENGAVTGTWDISGRDRFLTI